MALGVGVVPPGSLLFVFVLFAPSDLATGGAGAPYHHPFVHFRHNGAANVAWCDGHVKAWTQKFNVNPAWPDMGDLSADDSLYDLQ